MSFQKALGGFLVRHRKLRLVRNGTEGIFVLGGERLDNKAPSYSKIL